MKMENLRNFLNDFITVVRWELCIPDNVDWKLQAFSSKDVIGSVMGGVYSKDDVYIDYYDDCIAISGLTAEEYNSLSDLLEIW